MEMLERAWNVLEPGERPEGMPESLILDPATASWGVVRDRLIVAVEGVLHKTGEWDVLVDGDTWSWHKGGFSGRCPCFHADDRLTAAVLALESERGKGGPDA